MKDYIPQATAGRELALILDGWATDGTTGVAYFRNGKHVSSDLWEYVEGSPVIGIAGTSLFFSAEEIIAIGGADDEPFSVKF